MFIFHFLIANILISLISLILILIKKTFNYKISAKASYYIWIFIIFLMIFPFIPNINFSINVPVSYNINDINNNITTISGETKDYFVDVGINIYNILLMLWLFGVITGVLIYIKGYIKIKNICKNSIQFKNIGKIKILFSNETQTPFSFGIINKVIVLPQHIKDSNYIETGYVICHEFLHHKHKDTLINLILCFLNILYWFNPVVYYILDKIRLDMEIYCDSSVIELKGDNSYIDYCNTILNYAEKRIVAKSCNNLCSTKKQIKSRLLKIKNNNIKSNKILTLLTYVIIVVFVVLCSFVISVFGYSWDNYNFNSKNVESINLSEYFNGYDGCFVILNNNDYKIYNNDMAKKRYSPYSTYKIAIALNALENNIISAENNSMVWNNEDYIFPKWNKAQDLNSAIENSVNWYFQNLDKAMGYNCIKSFLNNENYGNKAVTFGIDSYWLDNTLKISPIEQTQFLSKIFNRAEFEPVKTAIKISEGFYGKTGSGKDCGWFIGALEEEQNYMYFALYVEGNGTDGAKAFDIVKNILESKKNIDN